MKAGKELENYVQFVYQKLLDFMDEGAMVSSNVSVIGKSGVKHEFDVYYEFQHLNMRHRIAIECKDWNRKEVIKLLGGVISGMNVGQPVIMQAANSEAQEPTEDVMDDADVAGLAMGWMSKGD